MRNRSKLIFLIVVLVIYNIIFIGGYFAYFYIFYPSYLSVQVGCNIINEYYLGAVGYSVSGSFDSSDNSISYCELP